ncbi:MAG: hypothetical protein GYB31_08835 [Bacteroidetes bacterium]|nr:hypothetical protein [Bacteroidota bacterium]
MRNLSTTLAVLLLTFLAGTAFRSAESPQRYCNSRYNFCVSYPADIFVTSEESPNDDGIQLTSKTEDVEMRVTGYYNVMGWGLKDEYNEIVDAIKSDSREQIKSDNPVYSSNRMTSTIQMGMVTTFVEIIKQDDHFVSLIIVTNRNNLNKPSHKIESLLSKISLEVEAM